MIDQVIPQDLAAGLHRIEFNEPCAFHYDNGMLRYSYSLMGNDILNKGPFDNKKYTAPVWCQAFDWFRNRGYHNSVDNLDLDTGDWAYKIDAGHVYEETNLWSIQEARIKCLTKLIEIHELRRA